MVQQMDWLDKEYRSRRLPAGGTITKCRPRRRWGRILAVGFQILALIVVAVLAVLNITGVIGAN